jgi:hypothetical protein
MPPRSLPTLPPRPLRAHRSDDPDAAARSRRLDCSGYDACLEVAARRGWRSFHCRGCSAYAPKSATQQHRELLALLELLCDSDAIEAAAAADTPPPPAGAGTGRVFLLDVDDTGYNAVAEAPPTAAAPAPGPAPHPRTRPARGRAAASPPPPGRRR